MALNPQIPLMGRQPEPPVNPLVMMREVMGIRDDAAKFKEAERLRGEAEQIRKVYQEVGIDPARRQELLGRVAQINPMMAEKLRSEYEKETAIDTENKRRAMVSGFDAMKQLAPYVQVITETMGTPEGWARGVPLLGGIAEIAEGAGMKGAKQMVASIPAQYSPEAHAQLQQSAEQIGAIAMMGQRPQSYDEFTMMIQAFQRENGRMPNQQELADIIQRSGRASAQATPNIGTFEDFVLRKYGQNPTPEQVIEARKEFSRAGSTAQVTDEKATRALAQQLVDRRLVPSQLSKRTSNYNEVIALADELSRAQTGKPYDPARSQTQFNAALRFVSSLNSPQQIRFRGLGVSVVNTIDEIKALADEMDLGGIMWANKAELEAKRQLFGNSPQGQLVARYLGATNVLKEEFANLINGGYAPTEAAFALANRQINENYGKEQMKASLSEVQKLINFRLNAFDEITPSGVSPDSPFFDPGEHREPTPPQKSTGFIVVGPDGKEWPVATPAEADAVIAQGKAAGKAFTVKGATATTAPETWPPKNPVKGKTYQSPTGPVVYDGTRFK